MAELWKGILTVKPALDLKTMPDEELTAAYVAMMTMSVISKSAWVQRIADEMRARGMSVPN